MRVKILILICSALVCASLIWLDYTHYTQPEAPQALALTQVQALKNPAPKVRMQDIYSDAAYEFAAYKGKWVLVNFWASWCAPCKVEMPLLLHMAKAAPDGVQLVLISNDTKAEDARTFMRAYQPLPANVLVVWDKDKTIARKHFSTQKYPETYVINPEGQMVRKLIGVISQDQGQQLQQLWATP